MIHISPCFIFFFSRDYTPFLSAINNLTPKMISASAVRCMEPHVHAPFCSIVLALLFATAQQIYCHGVDVCRPKKTPLDRKPSNEPNLRDWHLYSQYPQTIYFLFCFPNLKFAVVFFFFFFISFLFFLVSKGHMGETFSNDISSESAQEIHSQKACVLLRRDVVRKCFSHMSLAN